VDQYDVFLSHATPDKPAVEALAHRLQDAGLKPFLDKWHLIPGRSIQKSLETALDQSRSYAVCIGPGGIGRWQEEEMRSALDDRVQNNDIPVIPVLLPGAKRPGNPELPRFLRLMLWVDFSGGLDNEDAFKRLLAGIRGEAPGPGAVPAPKPIPAKPVAVDYSGKQKLAVCDRLGDSWSRLAMVLKIPSHDQARFSQGDEGRRIWEWLEIRGRLGELPGALEDIGREDLADILKT